MVLQQLCSACVLTDMRHARLSRIHQQAVCQGARAASGGCNNCCIELSLHCCCFQAYVQFVDIKGATAAKEAIHGRLFAGNPVQATYLTAQAYGIVIAAMEQS